MKKSAGLFSLFTVDGLVKQLKTKFLLISTKNNNLNCLPGSFKFCFKIWFTI